MVKPESNHRNTDRHRASVHPAAAESLGGRASRWLAKAFSGVGEPIKAWPLVAGPPCSSAWWIAAFWFPSTRPKRKPSEDKFRFAERFYFRKIRHLWRRQCFRGSQGYRTLPASCREPARKGHPSGMRGLRGLNRPPEKKTAGSRLVNCARQVRSKLRHLGKENDALVRRLLRRGRRRRPEFRHCR